MKKRDKKRWTHGKKKKRDRAKMPPDSVLACIDYGDRHVRYTEGQIGRTDS